MAWLLLLVMVDCQLWERPEVSDTVLICCAASAVDTELQHGLAAAVGDGGLPAVGAARGERYRVDLLCSERS